MQHVVGLCVKMVAVSDPQQWQAPALVAAMARCRCAAAPLRRCFRAAPLLLSRRAAAAVLAPPLLKHLYLSTRHMQVACLL
jgi:hypothetical protein